MSKQLLFLDTETTGNMPEDRLCQLCYKLGDTIVSELYKPAIPIKIDSMAVHHITNEMVKDAPAFAGSKEAHDLQKLFADGAVFVAHNAKFDISMLEKEGLKPEAVIDTYRVARYLDADGKIPSYRLQYLRYFLGIVIDATAHDAKGDVLVLEQLFERLISKIMETQDISRDEAIDRMIDISSRPCLFKSINFGKYKGSLVTDVAVKDPGSLKWLLDEKRKTPEDEEDWIYTLEKSLNV